MKTIFILAGFNLHSDASSPELKALRDGLSQRNYRVVPVPISWMRTTPMQYTTKFVDFYREQKGDYNIVIGNSFGAVVAVLSASELKPDELFLCSLSPFFKSDIHDKPDSYFERYFGKKRMRELREIDFSHIADQINQRKIKTTIVYGQKEHETSPPLVKRARLANKTIKNSRLIELPNSPHSMRDPIYTKELLKLL